MSQTRETPAVWWNTNDKLKWRRQYGQVSTTRYYICQNSHQFVKADTEEKLGIKLILKLGNTY